jgi:hypothetical protein
MKIIFTAFLLCISALLCAANVSVKGYTRADGTYVAPHMRSSPNGTASDNWSTKGNVNPYTGKAGTKTIAEAGLTPSSILDASTGGTASATVSNSSPQPNQLAPVFLLTSGAGSVAAAISAPKTNEALAEAASLSEKELMLKIFAKLIALEERVASIESTQEGKLATLRSETQSALNAVGEAFARIRDANPQGQSGKPNYASPSNAELLETKGGAPSLAQWRKITTHLSYEAVEGILGKPKKISNSGLGERWVYEGGGYVSFYSSGTVREFGGYSAGQ